MGAVVLALRATAPLLTATRNWREEILAYFDHPISNGYTEALNGVAKVINRSGRGYSFEVLRARLLFRNLPPKRKPVTGHMMSRTVMQAVKHYDLVDTLGGRCESCGGIFEGHELESHDLPPIAPGESVRRLYVCADCYRRFHTEDASDHNSQYTC